MSLSSPSQEPFFLYLPFSHVHTTASNQPEKQYAGKGVLWVIGAQCRAPACPGGLAHWAARAEAQEGLDLPGA